MEFKFRELTGNDFMTMLGLIDRLGLTDTLDGIFNEVVEEEQTSREDITSIGLKIVTDLAKQLIPRIPLAQDEVNSFLGSVVGMTAEEVGELPLAQYLKLVRDFFKHIDVKELSEILSPSLSE